MKFFISVHADDGGQVDYNTKLLSAADAVSFIKGWQAQQEAAQQPRALDAALWVCQNCGEASELSSQRCSVCNTPRQ